MTQEQIEASSQRKFRQIMDLMSLLQVRAEAKQKISAGGFIEQVVIFHDDERYQLDAAPAPVAEPVEEVALKEEAEPVEEVALKEEAEPVEETTA